MKGLPSLEELMRTMREGRLARERQIILEDRLHLLAKLLQKTYAGGDGLPSALELAIYMPAIRETIDVPADVSVGERELSAVCNAAAVSAFAVAWRDEKVAELRSMLETQTGVLPPDTDVRSLAVGRFKCLRCRAELLSSDMLSHCCFRGSPPWLRDQPEWRAVRLYAMIAMRAFVGVPRMMLEYIVPLHVTETIQVLELCGYNPWSVTLDTMDASPVRLRCKACGAGVGIMTWAAAVSTR